ncbi:MAG: hypothetical protein KBD37_01830 [Burkholderiales bacterium]|nr:hypothetical protein [Burkholderiales bacterium]
MRPDGITDGGRTWSIGKVTSTHKKEYQKGEYSRENDGLGFHRPGPSNGDSEESTNTLGQWTTEISDDKSSIYFKKSDKKTPIILSQHRMKAFLNQDFKTATELRGWDWVLHLFSLRNMRSDKKELLKTLWEELVDNNPGDNNEQNLQVKTSADSNISPIEGISPTTYNANDPNFIHRSTHSFKNILKVNTSRNSMEGAQPLAQSHEEEKTQKLRQSITIFGKMQKLFKSDKINMPFEIILDQQLGQLQFIIDTTTVLSITYEQNAKNNIIKICTQNDLDCTVQYPNSKIKKVHSNERIKSYRSDETDDEAALCDIPRFRSAKIIGAGDNGVVHLYKTPDENDSGRINNARGVKKYILLKNVKNTDEYGQCLELQQHELEQYNDITHIFANNLKKLCYIGEEIFASVNHIVKFAKYRVREAEPLISEEGRCNVVEYTPNNEKRQNVLYYDSSHHKIYYYYGLNKTEAYFELPHELRGKTVAEIDNTLHQLIEMKNGSLQINSGLIYYDKQNGWIKYVFKDNNRAVIDIRTLPEGQQLDNVERVVKYLNQTYPPSDPSNRLSAAVRKTIGPTTKTREILDKDIDNDDKKRELLRILADALIRIQIAGGFGLDGKRENILFKEEIGVLRIDLDSDVIAMLHLASGEYYNIAKFNAMMIAACNKDEQNSIAGSERFSKNFLGKLFQLENNHRFQQNDEIEKKYIQQYYRAQGLFSIVKCLLPDSELENLVDRGGQWAFSKGQDSANNPRSQLQQKLEAIIPDNIGDFFQIENWVSKNTFKQDMIEFIIRWNMSAEEIELDETSHYAWMRSFVERFSSQVDRLQQEKGNLEKYPKPKGSVKAHSVGTRTFGPQWYSSFFRR